MRLFVTLSFDTLRNGSASGWDVFQLVTGLSQISLTGQSPTQTVFPFQANCVVINFRSHNVYLSGCLIFEPVPYLYHGIVSFLDLLKGYHRLEPRISLLNPEPILLFFRISQVQLNGSSAMRALYKLFGFQANPAQFEFSLTMRA